MSQQTERAFLIQHVCLSDIQFSTKALPSDLGGKWEPNANFEINVKDTSLSNDEFRVNLLIAIHVKQKHHEDTNKMVDVFSLSLEQTGFFVIKGYSEEDLDRLLKSFCPNILFPYARQMVTQMTTQAGYPPLNLSPVDFETRYQESKSK
ncbi:MAG: protein-export chaperone SecB [Pseudomonadota bacterium]|nr:protein-export chaperone SecB [Pseudomonadota bacterium]